MGDDRSPSRRPVPPRPDPSLVAAIEAEDLPEPPGERLEAGLTLIRAALRRDASGWSRLPARLAAAAASTDGMDHVELYEPDRALHTRWERSAEGALSVTVTAADPGEPALVAVSWQTAAGPPGTLVTPLAPAPGGAFVRYEVTDVDRARRTVDIDVSAARPVEPTDVDLDAVRRAFAGRPKGVVIRAWRTYLERMESPARLDTVVRTLLRGYDG